MHFRGVIALIAVVIACGGPPADNTVTIDGHSTSLSQAENCNLDGGTFTSNGGDTWDGWVTVMLQQTPTASATHQCAADDASILGGYAEGSIPVGVICIDGEVDVQFEPDRISFVIDRVSARDEIDQSLHRLSANFHCWR